MDAGTALGIMKSVHDQMLKAYEDLLALGVPREQARGILPQNLMTKFYMTGNLRNWAHFARLRLDAHAQVEVQEVGKQVLNIMLDKFPEATKSLLGEKYGQFFG
jgi:thymidylate synthase (FAD)